MASATGESFTVPFSPLNRPFREVFLCHEKKKGCHSLLAGMHMATACAAAASCVKGFSHTSLGHCTTICTSEYVAGSTEHVGS